MRIQHLLMTALLAIVLLASGCKGKKGLGLNLFPLSDDIKLGKQVSQQIESDPQQFPILKEQGNEKVYQYIRGITRKILNSGNVKHKDNFVWQVKIIDDPKTLNAFCTPGGYIYVYTGLIKYLDSEDQLAGVMGHEIAHADLRHSTRQMTKMFGLQTLIAVVTGKSEPGMLEQVAMGLVNLKFSRSHETESDNHSVLYLCGTGYNAAGAAGFFEKIESEGSSRPPQFLSTHPNPDNRVSNIYEREKELGCSGKQLNRSKYEEIKRLLR